MSAQVMGALALLALSTVAGAAESICYGSPAQGRIEGAVPLPESGPNFLPYSDLGVALGRTYAHSRVARVVSAAYAELGRRLPDKLYLYGESGWAEGGRFRPHRTHQNGLSVDFMVPVVDPQGRSIPLPTGITNKWGYDIEFDRDGRYGELTIDFEAMGEHLYALHAAAREEGIALSRVIFDPAFLPMLHRSRRGGFIKANITFLERQAWVRHDEHYHVEFAVKCRPLGG